MYRVDVEQILREYSNNVYENPTRYVDPFVDDFESDEFRMYSFKIKGCPLNRPHDWTMCPYAHIGERARRRDPRRMPYMAVSCRDYRVTSGACPRGELCEYAHGVFEYWLHPAKYRTQICKAGARCGRRVCFFAHRVDELRIEPTIRDQRWALRSNQEEIRVGARMMMSAPNAPIRDVSSNFTGSNIGCRPGLGVIEHHMLMPNTFTPVMSHPSISSSSRGVTRAQTCESPQEMKLEFLENLRMLRISDYHNNNQVGQSSKGKSIYEDNEEPNVDWVNDLFD